MKNHPWIKALRPLLTAEMLVCREGLWLGMFGCGNASYAVDYCGQKDEYSDAGDTYKAGSKVKLTYSMIGTDTDYSFYLDGEPRNPHYKKGKGFVPQFTMPDRGVRQSYTTDTYRQ